MTCSMALTHASQRRVKQNDMLMALNTMISFYTHLFVWSEARFANDPASKPTHPGSFQ